MMKPFLAPSSPPIHPPTVDPIITMAMKTDISLILEAKHPAGVKGRCSIISPISARIMGQLAYCNRDGNGRQDGDSERHDSAVNALKAVVGSSLVFV